MSDFFDSILTPYRIIHDARQRLSKDPSDPKEIYRRANIIRERLKAQKRLGKMEEMERREIEKDKSLIRFDRLVRESQT